MKLAVVMALAACHVKDNRLLTPGSTRSVVKPPHEAIFVERDTDLIRMTLDTGDVVVIGPIPLAASNDGKTRIDIARDRYTVLDPQGTRVVDHVRAIDRNPELAPDEHAFFVTEPAEGQAVAPFTMSRLAIVMIGDLAATRFETGAIDRALWAADSSAVYVKVHDQWKRAELASGQLTELPKPPEELDASFDRTLLQAPTTCPARGLEASIDEADSQQRIVIDTIAGTKNPETLATLQRRVLIAAEHRTSHGVTALGVAPEMLGGLAFTRTCSHLLFTFGQAVYIADVETGKYALVTRGGHPRRAP
jgi:hypothetical protein